MTTWQLLSSTWSWEPSVLLGCLFLWGDYLVAVRGRFDQKTLCFGGGVLVIGVALLSPLDALGDTYLFSAHMLQHLLLLLVAPPLLLLGIPAWLAQRFLTWPLANRTERILGRPWLAWLLGVGPVWVWHLPSLYNATLADETIHILEHLDFLVTATIFWWPILAPLTERRLAPLAMLPYLFAAAAASSVLGIILTFAPVGLYPAYLNPVDSLLVLPLLRDGWGLSPTVDQQIEGVLMWVPLTN